MPKLAPVSWTELVRRLRELGFDGPYQGGKHPYMVKGNLVLTLSPIRIAGTSAVTCYRACSNRLASRAKSGWRQLERPRTRGGVALRIGAEGVKV